ncbi:glycosyltransferase [Romeria aff. gracilis LEGE 07310]|uniref:cellulose synthase (UDP-forming) n=1 Tax=Vasconcelosia minhoensis LEGE 07310 TaxID=915328 RepID=A0A8J7DRI2_9CYAN|nr:glycosyltransferase family 2 protein [Romeria gracilis]MBE9078604.1 glycosyltransferase [Romeria aff. gracilis LEGE 07310]
MFRWFEGLVFLLGTSLTVIWLTQEFWLNILAKFASFWRWGTFVFIAPGNSWQSLLLPSFILAACLLATQLLSPSASVWSRILVSGSLIFLGGRYLLWRMFSTLNLDDPLNGSLSLLLFFMELVNFTNTIAFFILTIPSIDRSSEADRLQKAVLDGIFLPWVDILIPTYNEPVAVLRRTIIGCQALDYPHKRIYLLDDTRRHSIRYLSQELGCFYLDRPDNRHAKAGNINHALPYLEGDLVTIFDADFVPTRNFLTRTVGFFQNPQVALVQTPQTFYNDGPIVKDLGLQGILTNEQALFFRHVQPSRDVVNAIICAGSSFVVRRNALDQMGGIPTASITEDFLISLKLQSLGYRLKYLNEGLSAGLAPESIGAYINQRLRWGRGTIQSIFTDANLFTLKGLSFIQRLTHGTGLLYWFLSLPRLVFLLIPLAYLLFQLVPLRATVGGLLYFFVPHYLGVILAFSWITKGRRSAFWSDIYETILCVPMTLTVFQTLINPFSEGFKTTPKGVVSEQIQINWRLVGPLLGLLALSLLGMLNGIVNSGWFTFGPGALRVNLFWTFYNIILLQISILAAIDVPKRCHTRFRHSLACELQFESFSLSAETVDLSEGGAAITLPQLKFPDQLPPQGRLRFSDSSSELSQASFNVELTRRPVRSKKGWLLGTKFINLSAEEERQLVEFLYCQPDQWQDRKIPEPVTAWAMVKSAFSFHSLAETR